MKWPLFILLFLSSIVTRSQTVSVVSYDTAFPVPNKVLTVNEYGIGSAGNMTGVTAKNGIYYVIGRFTNLTKYLGTTLMIDSATGAVKAPYRWRIDGQVQTAVADGQGGFYIGGSFTRIGDSIRNYIAHINGMGAPLPMNITVDSFVNKLYRRNDSLFLGGYFRYCSGKSRDAFAVFSLAGDSLCNAGRLISLNQVWVNDFLLKKDTVILAGGGSYSNNRGIRKYSFVTGVGSVWETTPDPQYDETRKVAFNADSSLILLAAGNYIRGINFTTGQQKYKTIFRINSSDGYVISLCTYGNTAYAAGGFDFTSPGGYCNGLLRFDVNTGTTLPNPITSLDGTALFVDQTGGRLYISGLFTSINGATRYNYAVLDTNSFAMQPTGLSLGDRLFTHCFSNGNLFISGDFRGVNPVPRYGLAAIDSATNTVLPWTTNLEAFLTEPKRIDIKGDTLFILNVTSRDYSCYTYTTQLRLYSLTTGLRLSVPNMNYQRMDDFVMDGNYAYVSADHNLRRYYLPTLQQDLTWGTTTLNGLLTPTCISVTADTIYAIADTRNQGSCFSYSDRAGFLIKLAKTAPYGSLPINSVYRGVSPQSDKIIFERSLLVNRKMYVQGMFTSLNGTTRRNIVCLNVGDGSINPLQPNVPAISPDFFYTTSNLKLYNGQVWFSSPRYVNDTFSFSGFGYIDTSTGRLQSADGLMLKQNSSTTLNTCRARNFLFNGNRLIIAGFYDSVNTIPVYDLSSQRITINYPSVTYVFTGSGNWNNSANWVGGMMPPAVLPSGSNIVIDPSGTGECILNVVQTVSPNCKVTVAPGKKLTLPQNLKIY